MMNVKFQVTPSYDLREVWDEKQKRHVVVEKLDGAWIEYVDEKTGRHTVNLPDMSNELDKIADILTHRYGYEICNDSCEEYYRWISFYKSKNKSQTLKGLIRRFDTVVKEVIG